MTTKEVSEQSWYSELKKAVEDRYVNVAITFVLLIGTIYILLVSLFDRNIIHPLSSANDNLSIDMASTVISLFVILLASLTLGWIVSIIKLPSLLGALLVGIAFRNIPIFHEVFVVNDRWQFFIRLSSLACIIVKWGIGLKAEEIRKRPTLPLLIGFLTPLVEVAAITLAGHFIFHISIPIAILGGFLLAGVSPAVTVPVMIQLQNDKRGEKKAIPTTVLASSSIDNVVCIVAFTTTLSCIFSTDATAITILWILLEIFTGFVAGCAAGVILWFFPRSSTKQLSVIRTLFLLVSTSAAIIGFTVVQWNCSAVICALLTVFVASTVWKHDNEKGTASQVKFFDSLWNLLCQPLLFALIGMNFDFDRLEGHIVLASLCLIAVGAIARFISTVIISSTCLNVAESTFTALSMLPKATVQAAFGPSLIIYTVTHPEYAKQLEIIITATIFVILITAPIGQLLLQVLAPILLKKDNQAVYAYNHQPFNKQMMNEVEFGNHLQMNYARQVVINRDPDEVSLRL